MMQNTRDPRAADLLFMSNPILPIVIVALYLGFVLKWGPAYMKNKKPYELKKPIIAYNIVQIIVNFYIFLEGVKIWKTYNWMCEPFDASYSEKALWGIRLCHAYFLIKIVDLLDTVFFVFRKKQSQITVLHVWHHSIMVLGTWIGVKYLPSGHGSLFGVINTLVHCFLYTYYLLAILGPEVRKYLWWKKYLTIIQLVQFCVVIIHEFLIFLPSCDYPKWTSIFIIPNGIIFYSLFLDFFRTAYRKTNDDKKKQ
ncbi:very long chain fatty acid elongase 7-like isoform X2 [Rhynchophorus ferrugineus]|uniref:very long chain fatty acid elongase 7-like isoform X2 n=1 Tax=Rhynchophorus ferrugineus TaxID=354439 RepID=UPI003FCC2886